MVQSQTFTAEITDLDRKGSGRAAVWRENEKGFMSKLKLTLPQTLPGEKVEAVVERPDKKRWWTFPDQIIEPSAERTKAPCPHFDRCGGCVWQHWQYRYQLQHKTEEVRSMLARQGFEPALVEETIGMEDPWHYRNKMEFTFSPEGRLGMHEQGNFRSIVELHTCLIAGESMVRAAMTIAAWAERHDLPGYDKDAHDGLLRHVLLRQSFDTGEVMAGIVATEAPDGRLAPLVDALKQEIEEHHPEVKSFLWLENTDWADRVQAESLHLLAGRDFIYDTMAGFRFRLWHDTFFQTNPFQAEKLVELALHAAEPQPHERMIDLFCGVGTFSLPFASRVNQLAGIEIVPASIASAERNAEENGLTNTTFLAKDARNGIDEMLQSFGIPELLMLDPPRSGAGGKVMRRIGRSAPQRIVYVSCNPETFAEDIAQLVPYGYELDYVQPVDLFPHTVHVELVALLRKKRG
ncbi:23S rRNA (uracil(1939)-C(5))-methyltransferase RlmD [Alkalicoccus chagannorensis]|uniref:23S rRNA (uracil(1939)-C(5))-methyltransferase RlmD n=1 Tax=Alkalicoccus chagannorensis TaxID=427072 RepID=UPI0003FC233B|nr:23S rRNA (uracil(1939)-C(5))-methyltransferase RlmD [Alkalicoccus chagannorensis]